MASGNEIFVYDGLNFEDEANILFIYPNLSQKLEFPPEFPAIIQVHLEHPAMSVPLHWHPGPELIYTRNKTVTVILDGKRVTAAPGDFVLIGSYVLHAIEPKADEVRQDVMSVTFQSRYLERMLPEMGSCVISYNAPNATSESREVMGSLLEQLRVHVEKSARRAFMTNAYLFHILDLMYTDFLVGHQDNHLKNLEVRNKMVDILSYIDTNYQQPMTTQSVADHFGYTREYFCRLFKQYSNHTFKQYLTELRLAAVVQNMKLSNRSVATIAMDEGFPDEKSFFIAFRKKYGVTPAQYKKAMGRR
ncbi:MAG: helix-turn-helix domain-containing protein [Faecousia sp.]